MRINVSGIRRSLNVHGRLKKASVESGGAEIGVALRHANLTKVVVDELPVRQRAKWPGFEEPLHGFARFASSGF